MASTSTLPTRDSQKTPVVVILNDIRVSLYSPPGNVIPWYINPLLKHVREANQSPRPYYLALVEYGSIHCASSTLSVISFSLFDPHNKSTKFPTGHKTGENHSGTTALDGYFAAIKVLTRYVLFVSGSTYNRRCLTSFRQSRTPKKNFHTTYGT